jgi:hypothetical protein
MNFKLETSAGSDTNFIRYVNADWARETSHWQSTNGYTFKLGRNAISWSRTKQAAFALSSTEAEYVAAANASQEVICIRQF